MERPLNVTKASPTDEQPATARTYEAACNRGWSAALVHFEHRGPVSPAGTYHPEVSSYVATHRSSTLS